MSKNPNLPESVQEELEQYVTQLTTVRATVSSMESSNVQREIISEVDALIGRCQTKDLAETLKSEELCALSDRVIAVHDRSLLLEAARSQSTPQAAAPK